MFEADEIYFDDDTHSYWHKPTGRSLISPTTILKKYSHPFDPDGKILERCAERKGVRPEELDKEWKKIGDDSRDRGHSVHFSFEHYIRHNEVLDDQNTEIINSFKTDVQPSLTGSLAPEVTLFNLEYGLAGRTDLIHTWWDNIVDILDFKSNRKPISKYAFGKFMFPPLSHLPDSKFQHYELQLSMYAFMLESQGYCPRFLNLLWVNKKNKVEVIPVRYLKQDVERMLSHYRYEKSKNK